MGNLKMVIENEDFKVKIDGEISWLKRPQEEINIVS